MTILKVTVEDKQAEALKKLLQEVPFIKNIEEEIPAADNIVNEPESAYERIKKIQEAIGNRDLFKDIKDPSEWQREIRKEWN